MHEILVNRLGGLSLPRKSVVRLTDRPAMTLDVYRGRKTTTQHNTITSYIPHSMSIGKEEHTLKFTYIGLGLSYMEQEIRMVMNSSTSNKVTFLQTAFENR